MGSKVEITARMAARQQEISALFAEHYDDILELDGVGDVQNLKRLVCEVLRVPPKIAPE